MKPSCGVGVVQGGQEVLIEEKVVTAPPMARRGVGYSSPWIRMTPLGNVRLEMLHTQCVEMTTKGSLLCLSACRSGFGRG